jgi:hypothetical protein
MIVFLRSPKRHARISSQTFSFPFQDALGITTDIIKLRIMGHGMEDKASCA